MRVYTLDRITMHDMPDPAHQPVIVEGKSDNALKIHFESEATKKGYPAIAIEHPREDFETNPDKPF
jgi:hypothetical protein